MEKVCTLCFLLSYIYFGKSLNVLITWETNMCNDSIHSFNLCSAVNWNVHVFVFILPFVYYACISGLNSLLYNLPLFQS